MSLRRYLSFCVLLAAVLLVGLGWRAEARSMQASRLHNGKPSQNLPPSFFVCKTADPFVCVRCSECSGIFCGAELSELEFHGFRIFAGRLCCVQKRAVCKIMRSARSRTVLTHSVTGGGRW